MNPYDAAYALTKTLRESPEFKEMKEAQAALKADESANQMVRDLRKQQLEMQKQQLSGIEISQEQEEKAERLMQIVNINLVAKRFLQAEYRIGVLIQDIYKIIGEATSEIIDEELSSLLTEDSEDEE